MVLAPVLRLFIVRFVAGQLVEKILPLLPWISVLGACCWSSCRVRCEQDRKIASSSRWSPATTCSGYLFGYLAGGRVRRRLRSELHYDQVGMQNSALAATLANPLRRHPKLPAAVRLAQYLVHYWRRSSVAGEQ